MAPAAKSKPEITLPQLIEGVRQRTTAKGITTAYGYLHVLEGCMEGGACPVKFLHGVPDSAWKRALKESQNRLVYHAPDMEIQKIEFDMVKAVSIEKDNDLPIGACGVFDAVVTSRRQDRDGDVLESKGGELDPRAPLLWQHMPFEPIGRLVRELSKNTQKIAARLAIIDNQLGNDAAQLVEFDALRISHGFLPREFEPLDIKDPWAGFLVKLFEIIEVSLVSVPSNPDAVIMAFSRQKLHHPLVKQWAGAMYRERATQGVGLELGAKGGDGASAQQSLVVQQGPAGERATGHACTCGGQAAAKSGADQASGGKAPMEAQSCPKCGSELDEAGKCKGPDCDYVLRPKAAAPEETKRGRTISGRNETLIGEAREDAKELVGMDGLSRSAKSLAERIVGKLDLVLASAGGGEEEDKSEPPSLKTYLDGLLAEELTSGDLAPLQEVQRLINGAVAAIEQRQQAEFNQRAVEALIG